MYILHLILQSWVIAKATIPITITYEQLHIIITYRNLIAQIFAHTALEPLGQQVYMCIQWYI